VGVAQHMKSCYNNRGGMFVLRGTKWSFVYNGSLIFTFTGCNSSDLPPRRPRFVPKLVHLTFMVEKVAVGQNFPTSNSVFPHSSRCSIHLHLCVAVTGKRERDEGLEPSKKINAVSVIGIYCIEKCCHVFVCFWRVKPISSPLFYEYGYKNICI